MNTQTSLVAEQIRLQQWADQIRDCQNRPSDMKVDAWCQEHGITKANYYYRLRRVREACLKLCEPSPSFVELTAPKDSIPAPQTAAFWKSCSPGHRRCRKIFENKIYSRPQKRLIVVKVLAMERLPFSIRRE